VCSDGETGNSSSQFENVFRKIITEYRSTRYITGDSNVYYTKYQLLFCSIMVLMWRNHFIRKGRVGKRYKLTFCIPGAGWDQRVNNSWCIYCTVFSCSISRWNRLKNGTKVNTTDSYRRLEAWVLDESPVKCQAMAVATRRIMFSFINIDFFRIYSTREILFNRYYSGQNLHYSCFCPLGPLFWSCFKNADAQKC
jgi:hypothetical protein